MVSAQVYPIHGVAYATTSIPEIDVAMELAPARRETLAVHRLDDPHLEQRANPASKPEGRPGQHRVAVAVLSSQRTGEVQRAGPYPAFLGNQFSPHFASFQGKATKKITKTLTDRTIEFDEPYAGTSADSYFTLGGEGAADLTLDRMNTRKSLLDQMEDARRSRGAIDSGDPFREMAYSLVGSNAVRNALDIRRESAKTRELYGHFLFGQSCLAACRLVEAGSKFVTCFWDEFGLAGSGWDTHWEHYPRMRNELDARVRPRLRRA